MVTPRDFAQALFHAEETYLIRLYAEFEGILKDHLVINHSHVRLPNKPKVDWLITRVLRAEAMTIEPPLRQKMDIVRDYRNSIAHRSRQYIRFVSFDDALSVLNRFLARMPNTLR